MALAGTAARDDAEARGIVWEVRLGLVLGLPALAWGGLVAGLLIGGALVFRGSILASGVELAEGGPPVGLGFATRVALVASLTIGYTLCVWRWLVRSQLRDLELAAGRRRDPAAHLDEQRLHEMPLSFVRRSRWGGLAGVLIFVCFIEGPNALAGLRPLAAWTSLHALTYMLFLGVLFFWIAGRAAYFSVAGSRQTDPLESLEIDLLDPRPLYAVGRMALRGALTWVVGLSISTLAFANPELRFRESLMVFGPLLALTLAIATAALLLPVRGLHRRIVAVKREELDRVEAAIRGDRSRLVGARIAARADSLSLADLIAYRDLVSRTHEWPFETAALRRFGFYLLIPLLSWVGGALVERFVGLALD
jgi:hypothetical protein